MSRQVVIIGAGIGGLSAGTRLAQAGYKVTIFEARQSAGGLASGMEAGGFTFDSGPYILLDKPGLDWAFSALRITADALPVTKIDHVYEVLLKDDTLIRFNADIGTTAAAFEQQFAGSGKRYREFVQRTFAIHQELKPLTYKTHPGIADLIANHSVKHIPFLLRSLGSVLRQSKLATPLQEAISIWTHIAGQDLAAAPSPMAFVPGLFHNVGSFYPAGGMNAIAMLLTRKAVEAGVAFVYGSKVTRINTVGKQVTGVTTADGLTFPAAAVISNASGIGTYTSMIPQYSTPEKEKLAKLPLQSPGVCIYLAVKGRRPPYYIRFKLREGGCVAFVQPGLMDPGLEKEGWFPARLIAPLDHKTAQDTNAAKQHDLMQQLLAESWWQEGIMAYKVLQVRSTHDWGREFNLYRDSMNPVMTAQFMLKGRIAHRSSYYKGLYLTGSSTHPGQWVSFCAISGVLAADCVLKDTRDA